VNWQDALQTVGPQAGHILDLWRLMLVVCTAVFVALLFVLGIALWRAKKSREPATPDLRSLHETEPVLQRRVGLAAALSALALLGLVGASAWTDRELGALPLKDALHVCVTANQWWWDLRYDDADPSKVISTANELHVPVGRPVLLTLQSNDVIHSFWVPNLAGKKDLIPGRSAQMQFRADRAGVYRGQCAEFCGAQHAWMAFLVIAEEPAQYEAWAERQRASAQAPGSDGLRTRGEQLFLAGTCPMCHAIGGTDASARRAPDLTHVGGRRTLAAGALGNDASQLAAWIADPQRFKPGVNMPGHASPAEDLRALVAYLEGLK
jgi:cytochrome c oxidase subunit 2